MLGGGLRTPRVGPELDALIERLGFPVALTWAALDLMADDHPLRIGPFGVYGPRLGNFAIQNADLLVCLGTRLSQNVTGGLLDTFAREARHRHGRCRARRTRQVRRPRHRRSTSRSRRASTIRAGLAGADRQRSVATLADWHHGSRAGGALPTIVLHRVPPARAMSMPIILSTDLSDILPEDELIFVDTGGNLTWTCNGLRAKRRQRVMSAWNNTPMGYALPARSAPLRLPKRPGVTCIVGDGGLMICLAELSTLVEQKMPIKVLVFNNHGHGIQKQTLETWLDGRYVGVDEPSGLSFPPIGPVARAMGLKVIDIAATDDIAARLREAYADTRPVLCNVEINPAQKLYPVLKFGSPLEDQLPGLDPKSSPAR